MNISRCLFSISSRSDSDAFPFLDHSFTVGTAKWPANFSFLLSVMPNTICKISRQISRFEPSLFRAYVLKSWNPESPSEVTSSLVVKSCHGCAYTLLTIDQSGWLWGRIIIIVPKNKDQTSIKVFFSPPRFTFEEVCTIWHDKSSRLEAFRAEIYPQICLLYTSPSPRD